MAHRQNGRGVRPKFFFDRMRLYESWILKGTNVRSIGTTIRDRKERGTLPENFKWKMMTLPDKQVLVIRIA